MKYERYSMFKIPTINVAIDSWAQKKQKLMDLYDHECIERRDNNFENLYTSYYSGRNPENNQKDEVYHILKEEIDFFYQELGLENCCVSDTWFQRYEKEDHYAIHTHGSLGYSFVCYVEYNSDYHLPTTFISPFLNFLTGNTLTHRPDVSEGNIIFFPSSIMHFAPRNESKEPRIILSGNITNR